MGRANEGAWWGRTTQKQVGHSLEVRQVQGLCKYAPTFTEVLPCAALNTGASHILKGICYGDVNCLSQIFNASSTPLYIWG